MKKSPAKDKGFVAQTNAIYSNMQTGNTKGAADVARIHYNALMMEQKGYCTLLTRNEKT
jgi:hypothetical protein